MPHGREKYLNTAGDDMKWLRRKIEKWKAEVRGEKLKEGVKEGERGRIFVKSDLKPSIYAKVYRASEGKWYDLGRIG